MILSREITVGSKWSLVDYKRRVSPSATIQAKYVFDIGISSAAKPSMWEYDNAQGYAFSPQGAVLGLAVGGQMYGAFDLTLSIVYFNQIIFRAQKIYRDKDSPRVWCTGHFKFKISQVGQILGV